MEVWNGLLIAFDFVPLVHMYKNIVIDQNIYKFLLNEVSY